MSPKAGVWATGIEIADLESRKLAAPRLYTKLKVGLLK